jgi:hypothetical protein
MRGVDRNRTDDGGFADPLPRWLGLLSPLADPVCRSPDRLSMAIDRRHWSFVPSGACHSSRARDPPDPYRGARDDVIAGSVHVRNQLPGRGASEVGPGAGHRAAQHVRNPGLSPARRDGRSPGSDALGLGGALDSGRGVLDLGLAGAAISATLPRRSHPGAGLTRQGDARHRRARSDRGITRSLQQGSASAA